MRIILLGALTAAAALAQGPQAYTLGPGGRVSVRVVAAPETSTERQTLGPSGELRLPMINAVSASGMTAGELERELRERLSVYIKEPLVSVTVEEFASRPVSVLGAVGNPGVQKLTGGETLAEVLSTAGGLRVDACASITVTRRREWGKLPLPGAALDPSGEFYVAHLEVRKLLEGQAPELNIKIQPHDVISAPRAALVYVVGAVKRAGAFPLTEGEQTSALRALALAGGLAPHAALKRSLILRRGAAGELEETSIDLKAIVNGQAKDPELAGDQILFVPKSNGKSAAAQLSNAALVVGTGASIWTLVGR